MELNQYLRLFRKWAWLILLAAVLGGAVALLVRDSQEDVYQAQTKIMIGSYMQASNPDAAEIRTGAELGKTYVELVKTRPVMEGTIQALDLDMGVGELRGSITIALIPDTSLLELTVQDTDPDRAAAIANEVANQLKTQVGPQALTTEEQQLLESSRNQISQLNTQLTNANTRLDELSQQIDNSQDPNQIVILQAQYDNTTNRVAQLTTAIAELQRTISNLQQRSNSLTVWEAAMPPGAPISKGLFRFTLLGGLVGVILAGALVLLINYQQTSIRTAEEATGILDLPVLGTIAQFGGSNDSYSQRLITHYAPTSPIAETYNALQANLLFGPNGEIPRKGIYIITSPGPGEGKSITAANLAVTAASAGLRVLLIDADLRQPRLHEILEVPNRSNLAHLFTTSPADLPMPADEGRNRRELPPILKDSIQPTDVLNLWVITSGQLPDHPSQVLNSKYLPEWVKIFQSYLGIDVVLFDSPPCLLVADSSSLASNLNAKVILVVEAGRTQREAAQRAKAQFAHIGRPVAGIVLNKVNPRDHEYGYGHGYYVTTSENHASSDIS